MLARGIVAQPKLDYTTASGRQAFRQKLIDTVITPVLQMPLDEATMARIPGVFWASELMLFRSPELQKLLNRLFTILPQQTLGFQRSWLEAVYTLYPNGYSDEAQQFLQITHDPKIFAMSAEYLLQSGEQAQSILKILKEKFPDYHLHPILTSLNNRLTGAAQVHGKVKDLLCYRSTAGQAVMYSIQRPNRDFPGLVILRKPDGSFLRNGDGSLFAVQQLARSITNLPGYLTNGNTPQGVFSIQGIDTSENYFIGPTPNIQLVLPFEVPAWKYFHAGNKDDTIFTRERYTALLPPSWRNISALYEAFNAGKAGRCEIIAHGTTIDPEFYNGTTYYPNTPSLGCLCAYEQWDTRSGGRVVSNQQLLIDRILSMQSMPAYCYVVETDAVDAPVTVEEIEKLIK